jgi:hypothetical protein
VTVTSRTVNELFRDNIFLMLATDTSAAAQAIQLDIHRSMSGEQRLLLAFEMSIFARALNRERVRQEHPEWTHARVERELLRLAFLPAPLPADLR